MEKNYISIDRTQTDELIETLSFLQLQVLATLKNDTDGGLIKELQETINTMTNHIEVIDNLKEDSDQQVKKIEKKAIELVKINETLESSSKIIAEFEKTVSKKLDTFSDKLDLEKMTLENDFEKQIKKLKDELIEDVSLKIEDINKEIKIKIKDIDLKKIDASNRFVSNAVIQLDLFKTAIEKTEKKNRLLSSILSAIGGAVFTSLIFIFLSNKEFIMVMLVLTKDEHQAIKEELETLDSNMEKVANILANKKTPYFTSINAEKLLETFVKVKDYLLNPKAKNKLALVEKLPLLYLQINKLGTPNE